MRKRFAFLIFILCFYTNTICAQSTFSPVIAEAKTLINTLLKEENVVGLSVTVSIEDTVVWSEGFGYSDLKQEKIIEPDKTLFRIASLSKPITATILGQLYDKGSIDLEKSVYEYVPRFPKKKYDFNVMQLAMHRSGIRHYKASEKENQEPLSMKDGLRKFEKSKLKFEPGSAYLYSSYGYNLLGVVMEKASKTSFSHLLKKYITQPLKMNNTIPDHGVYDTIQTSGFFEKNHKGEIFEAEPVYLAYKVPSGGMLSTSEDLVKFGNSYTDNHLLKEDTLIKMTTENPLPNGEKTKYGMGWGLRTDKKGERILSHTGGNTGAVCRILVHPKKKVTLALVSNTFGIDWLKFIKTVDKIFFKFLKELDK